MRKSIKRFVSSVLAASMVLTGSLVTNLTVVSAASAPEGNIITAGQALKTGYYADGQIQVVDTNASLVDDGEWAVKEGGAVTLEDGSTVEYSSSVQGDNNPKGGDGGNSSYNQPNKLVKPTYGAYLVIKPTSDTTLTLDVKIGSGKSYAVMSEDANGVLEEVEYDQPSANAFVRKTYDIKAGLTYYVTSAGSKTTFYAIAIGNYSDTPEETTEATTEVTTVEETTEVTTVETTEVTSVEYPTEATTEAPIAPAEKQVVITPEYTVDGDTLTVKYNAALNNAGFNHYTMFVTFDPAVLTPVSAEDGDITIAVKDALGQDVTLAASNAENIISQFTNVPLEGNSDFEGADGIKTQAELGKVKVAYCVFDKAFDQAATGSLPEFTANGTLFTVKYKINDASALKGTKLGANVQVLDTVSSDLTVLGTADAIVNEVTVSSDEPGSDESSTETTTVGTTETTTEVTTEAVTGVAIYGDTVNAANGKATLTFKINENPGVANYLVFVTYNSADLMATGGTVANFDAGEYGADVINKQVIYKPTANDPDYAGLGADGTKTAAELGKIKIAGISKTNVTDEDAVAFTIDFDVTATAAGTYPVDVEVVAVGNENAELVTCGNYPGYVVIKSTEPPTDDTSESTTEGTTEATTADVTETTTVEPSSESTTSQVTTDAATETTTRRPSQGSGGGGGGGGGGKPQVTTTTEATTETTTDEEAPDVVINDNTTIKVPTEKDPDFTGFTDLGNYPWAEDSINKLAELGIISGIGDGQYGPALPCRRADFAILINRTLGVSVNSMTKNFYDNEDQSKYYYNDVRIGYNAGILSGYGDNNYKPEQYCTREEMAVLVAKTFEWLGNDVTSTDLSVNNKYTDVDNISWWSAPYVAYLTDMGVLNGNADGTLLPKNYINRAEMAVMMSKVYDYALDLVQSMTTTEATTEETTEETTVDESSTETTTEAATETTTVVDEDL